MEFFEGQSRGLVKLRFKLNSPSLLLLVRSVRQDSLPHNFPSSTSAIPTSGGLTPWGTQVSTIFTSNFLKTTGFPMLLTSASASARLPSIATTINNFQPSAKVEIFISKSTAKTSWYAALSTRLICCIDMTQTGKPPSSVM